MFKDSLSVRFSQLTGVAIIAFLVSFTFFSTSPVFPIFAEKISGSPENVGLIASVFGASAVIINLLIARFFERYGVLKNLRLGLLLYVFVFASYLFVSSPVVLVALQIVLASAVCFTLTSLSILVNSSSKKENLGGSEGEYFTSINSGILLGMPLGGVLAMSYGYSAVFLFAAVAFLAIFFLTGRLGIKDNQKHKHISNIFYEVKRFFKDAQLRRAYVSNIGLYFWFSAMILYIPIILKSLGLNFGQIGFVFAAVLTPYLLLEYIVGKLAEKEGSAKFISAGFFAIALASLLIYANYGAVYSMSLFFFLSFMGAAAIEPLNEMRLDQLSNKGNIVENMAIFKTSLRLAYFLGPLSAAALIGFFGIKEMFLVLAVVMAGFWIATNK